MRFVLDGAPFENIHAGLLLSLQALAHDTRGTTMTALSPSLFHWSLALGGGEYLLRAFSARFDVDEGLVRLIDDLIEQADLCGQTFDGKLKNTHYVVVSRRCNVSRYKIYLLYCLRQFYASWHSVQDDW